MTVYHQLIRELALEDVALKVSDGGVTRTNTNKIRATMLQVKNLQHVAATKCCVKNRPVHPVT